MKMTTVLTLACLLYQHQSWAADQPTPPERPTMPASHDRYGSPYRPSSRQHFVPKPSPAYQEVKTLSNRINADTAQLLAKLKQRDENGYLTSDNLRVARVLGRLRTPDALPFLVENIAYAPGTVVNVPTRDPVMCCHPFLEVVVCEYQAAGIQAILDHLSACNEARPRDWRLDLFAYAVLYHCGFDEAGRKFALEWIALTEKRQGRTGALNRLREQLPLTTRRYL